MKRTAVALGIVLCLGATPAVSAQANKPPGYVPPNGVIPDSLTAARVAEAILTPIYGVDVIKREQPLTARLANGVWIVSGSPPELPPGRMFIGGLVEIRLKKRDGRVIYIWHDK